MTIKKAAKSQGNRNVKKLALKREKLADLSPRGREADQVRGQSYRIGGERANHNETLVLATRRR